MTDHILLAGVGNIFLGDDGFGVEVVRCLAHENLPPEVRLVDFGIRGLDLAYAILDPWQAVILIDALPRGGPAGTVYLIEPDLEAIRAASVPAPFDTHTMNPMNVLRLAFSMADSIPPIYVVGCEPGDFGDELEGRMGLSEAVSSAIPEAMRITRELLAKSMAKRESYLVEERAYQRSHKPEALATARVRPAIEAGLRPSGEAENVL